MTKAVEAPVAEQETVTGPRPKSTSIDRYAAWVGTEAFADAIG